MKNKFINNVFKVLLKNRVQNKIKVLLQLQWGMKIRGINFNHPQKHLNVKKKKKPGYNKNLDVKKYRYQYSVSQVISYFLLYGCNGAGSRNFYGFLDVYVMGQRCAQVMS